jgi:hypothetical protein
MLGYPLSSDHTYLLRCAPWGNLQDKNCGPKGDKSPTPAVERSKARTHGLSLAETARSNPAGDRDVCFL